MFPGIFWSYDKKPHILSWNLCYFEPIRRKHPLKTLIFLHIFKKCLFFWHFMEVLSVHVTTWSDATCPEWSDATLTKSERHWHGKSKSCY